MGAFDDLPDESLLDVLTPSPAATVPTPVAAPAPANPPGPLGRALNVIPTPIVRTVADQAELAAMVAKPPATPRADRVVSALEPLPKLGGFVSPKTERAFQKWYKAYVTSIGLPPDPDAATNKYDWRAAFVSNAKPHQVKSGDWLWPGDFIINRAEQGDRVPIPDWTGGVPGSRHPTFGLENDMEEPAYRTGLGIWRGGNKI